MTGNDIAYDVWYALGDSNKTVVSPPHMLSLVNEAIGLVSDAFNASASRYLIETITITMSDGEGALPDDYDRFVGVWSGTEINEEYILEEMAEGIAVDQYTYRIEGNVIYSTNDNLFLKYKKKVAELSNLDSAVSLPDTVRRNMKNLILRLIKPSETGEEAIEKEMVKIKAKCARRTRRGRVSRLSFTVGE